LLLLGTSSQENTVGGESEGARFPLSRGAEVAGKTARRRNSSHQSVNYGNYGNYGNVGNYGNPGNYGSIGLPGGFEDVGEGQISS
jgi:hypothetical protein